MENHQDLDQIHHNNTINHGDGDLDLDQSSLKNEPVDLELDHGDDDLDLDHDQNTLKNELDLDHDQNTLKNELDLDHGDDDGDGDDDLDLDLDQEDDEKDTNRENILNNYRPDPLQLMDHNYPPESFSVCQAKVADWLNHHTVIERKTSVKFAICKNNQDPTQTRSANRAISLNHQRPKLSIIGFRKKPVHQSEGSRSKHSNDRAENVRLFRNRSEPGRDYCLLITEPVSPKVSCVGRVGSVRVQGNRKAGVWRSMKAAFTNLVHTSRVTKVVA